MSLPINTDGSTQPNFNFYTSNFYDGSATSNFTSNYTSNISNILNTKIDTKQDTLTALTNLLGVGSAISALDYNKITLNKPIDFQANWNTTITNKPTNFQSDWNSTIINKPSTFPADMTNIYNKSEVNNISVLNNYPSYTAINTSNFATYSGLNSCNYLLKTGGTMSGALLNTSTTTSEFKGIQFAHPTRITHIPYLPDGNIYFRAPVLIDNTADYLSFGSRIGDNFLRLYGTDYGLGVNSDVLRYNCPSTASHKFYSGTTNTATIGNNGTITATGFSGNGAGLTSLTYGNITGVPDFLLKSGGTLSGTLNGTTINATTALQEGGTNLTSKYLQLAGGNMTANANITLSGTGTFSGIHSGNGAGLTSLTYGNITGVPDFLLKSGGVMTGQITGVSTLNATTGIFGSISTTNTTNLNTPQLGAFGGTGDRIILYVGTASVHPYSLGMNSSTLWYSVPAGTSHIFYVGGSPITTISSTGLSTTGLINASTNLQEAGVNLTSKYLKLDGTNTMSGALNIASTTTDNQIVITNPTATRYTSIKMNNGTANGYIGIGGSGLTGTSYYNNNLFVEATNSFIIQTGNQNTANIPRMIINNSGNIGIATTNPSNILQVADGARLRISNGVSDYSLIGTKDVDDNTNTRIVISGNTRSGYQGNIQYLATAGSHIFYTNATNERMRIDNSGNVGIGTITMSSKVHIEHSSTTFNGANGGFYLYNPNNTANSSSCIGARIAGSLANRAGVSLDVNGGYGWSMYINGNDTTEKWLRFNSSWDGAGSERLQIRGSDGYTNINGGLYIADYTTIRQIVNDRGGYNHASAPLTITNQTATGTTLNDSLPILNICRQGVGGVAYGARATMCLSRFANDNVWSRTRLDFKLASDTYNDVFAMTLRSDGNTFFYPNPQNINNTNGANYAVNLNVACFTTGLATAPFITCIVNDGWNGIDTSTIITAQSGANSGYNNASRIYLDASYNTNAGFGTLASYISFQSINSGGGWNTNAYLRTTNTSITFRVDGNISCFSLTQTSTSNIKTDIQPIENALNIITQLEGHYYKNIKTDNYDYGLIAEEVENVLPDIVDKTNEDLIGISYTSLIPILIEGVKELKNKVNNLQKENEELKNRLSLLEQIY